MGTIAVSGAAAKPVSMQGDAELAGIFYGRAQPTLPSNDQQGGKREKNIAMPQRRAAVKKSPIYANFFEGSQKLP
jgi:hypothetical protein